MKEIYSELHIQALMEAGYKRAVAYNLLKNKRVEVVDYNEGVDMLVEMYPELDLDDIILRLMQHAINGAEYIDIYEYDDDLNVTGHYEFIIFEYL